MLGRLAAFLLLASAALIAAGTQERPAGLWLDVPFFKQTEEGCGSAAIAMVMRYWAARDSRGSEPASDPERIQKLLFSPKAHGIFASAMQKYLRDSGYDVFAISGSWDDLREHLLKGRPLIAGLRPSRNKAALHYVVIVGLDTKVPAVFLNDPARGALIRVERGEFQSEWSVVDNWLLVVLPHAKTKTPSSAVE
jgi:ABC-type bacteriocin/lantibiotic exporter with double-glycine peptidase domain